MAIGCMVTLRGDRMYEFLDRLVNVALPRVRDFRGVSSKSFDGRGNYTLGVKDQLIFPEIDYAKVEKTKGMNICITTTARTDAEGLALLKQHGDAVPAVKRKRKTDGYYRQDRERPETGEGPESEDAEAAMPASQPLLALRTSARLPAQVWHLPPVLPPARPERRDPRRDQGELVGKRCERSQAPYPAAPGAGERKLERK